MDDEAAERKTEWNSMAKSARSPQPPRRGRAKVVQEYVCPCWTFKGKKCPECKGEAEYVPDPSDRAGAKKSSCPVCECKCSVGPYKNKDRGELKAAFVEWKLSKTKRPVVSEDRNPGVGVTEMVDLALQVWLLIYLCVLL